MTSNSPKRILVVDDNRDAADLTATLLAMYGHVAVAAYGGAEGLELANRFVPDAILLDLTMPEIDGFAVAVRIRDYPSLERTAVIAFTAKSDEATRARTAAAGFRLHLVKPMPVEAIIEALASIDS
jgi:CheY-like chemotaxis protein